jgi:hypothetical protein
MNPIIQLAASALPGEKKYILMAGAGVSKDAGIPTNWDLMLKTASLLYAADNPVPDPKINLEEWFVTSKYAEMEYARLIGILYPHYPDQQDLKKYLDGKQIGQSHRGIAELARRGIIRAIVTTNFDHYVEKALEEKGLDVQVISTDEDIKNSEPLIHCKAVRVYKPHGDLGHGALRNTPKDLRSLSPLMEEELVSILGEHGVIVLGYAGRDEGMQRVFIARDYGRYPLFWVSPNPPEGKIKEILEAKSHIYIPCEGASQFIQSFLRILDRLEELAPVGQSGPTIADLEYAFSSKNQPIGPLYSEYLSGIYKQLEQTRPDFSKYAEYDEAIVAQIDEGRRVSFRFIEGVLLASKYGELEAATAIYNWFGNALKLCDRPEGFSGTYRTTDFDGFKFLVYEMFVSFVACLIKYDRWDILTGLLKEDLFIDMKGESGYVPFASISMYVESLDRIRNARLNLRRMSVMADLLKERFTKSDLSELVRHDEFMEADYFLFLRTVCHVDNLQYLRNVWKPFGSLYLDGPPRFVVKCQSKRFLENMTSVMGFEDSKDFVARFVNNHHAFREFFGILKTDPLAFFDFSKIGTHT